MSKTIALKHYFGLELGQRLSDLITPHYADFSGESFIDAVVKRIEPLELKGRVAVIAEELHKSLPLSYSESILVLLEILGPENETEQGMFTNGYFLMPIAFYVEKYGLEDFNLSMHALYEITKRHTSEYAVRPFLERYPDESMKLLNNWLHDPNPHIRRLVSESTRPRLPWAKRIGPLSGDPSNNLGLLSGLLNDPSFYVRKSVANHINDLTKDYKEMTLDWIGTQIEQGENGTHLENIVRHGLRSLVKKEDNQAIKLLKLIEK